MHLKEEKLKVLFTDFKTITIVNIKIIGLSLKNYLKSVVIKDVS